MGNKHQTPCLSHGYMSILVSTIVQSQMLHDHVVSHFSFQHVVHACLLLGHCITSCYFSSVFQILHIQLLVLSCIFYIVSTFKVLTAYSSRYIVLKNRFSCPALRPRLVQLRISSVALLVSLHLSRINFIFHSDVTISISDN